MKNPSFPEKELDRLKLQRLSQLKARADDPEQTAAAVFPRLIYGLDHPYGRPDLGTPASVRSITREDVLAFYRRIMLPSNAVLVVVGDIRPDAIAAAMEARLSDLGQWPGPAISVPRADADASAGPDVLPDRQAGRGAVDVDHRTDRRRASRPISPR